MVSLVLKAMELTQETHRHLRTMCEMADLKEKEKRNVK